MSADLRELRTLEPQFYRAPSAHNTQPWLLEYTADRIELRFDPARALPLGDPSRRDLLLSLGAFVETVLIVAASARLALAFEPQVELESRSLGSFVPSEAPYTTRFTVADVERRQTSRSPYEPRRLTTTDLAAAGAELGDGVELRELEASHVIDLYVEADRHLYDTPPVVYELKSWLRLSRRDSRYAEDGLSYDCLGLGPVQAAAFSVLLQPRVYGLVRATRLHRLFTTMTKSLLQRDGSALVLSSASEPPQRMLENGRALMRVWLALAQRGLYTHPLTQILDCETTERKLATRVGALAPQRPFNVFRVGRSEPPPRSARLR